MAENGLTKTFKKLFGKSKPNEFSSRLDIDQALRAVKSPLAPSPLVTPTHISDKGIQTGTLFVSDSLSGQNYYRYLQRETVRHSLYSLFSRMDADGLIASSLDVYANEATVKNYNNIIVDVSCQSKFIEDELKDMLELVGINNHRSWGIIREMCKLGDSFQAIVLDSEEGVVGLKPLDPSSVYRVEKDGELLGYIQDMSAIRQSMTQESASTATINPYINLNTLAIPYLSNSSFNRDDDSDSDTEQFVKYELLHFRLRGRGENVPYGMSVLQSCVDIWKKLDLLVDSLIVYRLNRAPARLVFYVDVGNNQGGDVENLVLKQINSINKKEFFDSASGKINERYRLLDMNANIFIPVKPNSASKVEMLPGAGDIGSIEDMKYLNDRLFSALKVPKSFLGFDGDVNSKATLSQQNVTFGKAIQNLQEDFLSVIRDLCVIHLAVRGISTITELKSFDLTMTRPSYIEEKARIELESERMGLADAYKQFGANRKWAAKHILMRSDAEIAEMFIQDPLDAQAAGAGGGGMGLPMGGGGMESALPPGTEGELPPEMTPPPTGAAPVSLAPEVGSPMPQAGLPQGEQPLTQGANYSGDYLIERRNLISTKVSVKNSEKLITECMNFLADDIKSKFKNKKVIKQTGELTQSDEALLD